MFVIGTVKRAVNFLKKPDGEKQVAKRLLHGISWTLLSSVLIRATTFITALVNSHILGKHGYGELGLILNTLILFGILSSGYGATCSKYIAELKDSNPNRAGKIFTLSTILTISITIFGTAILYFGADQIANNTLNASHLASPLRIACIALVAQAIIGVSEGVLLGLQAFKLRSNIGVIQAFIWLPTTAFLSNQWQLNGALIAYVISYVIAALSYIFILYRECKRQQFIPVLKNIWSECSIIFNFTLPVLFNSLLVIPTNWICSVILANQTNGFAELGGYNAANQWRILVLQIPILIQATVSPMMNESLGKKDLNLFYKLFLVIYKAIFCLSLIVCIFGISFSRQLMTFFGDEFTSEYKVMMLVMITALIISMSGFIGNTLLIINKTWQALVVNVVLGTIAVSLSFVLAPRYGGIGLCISFLIGYFIQCLVSIYLLNRFFRKITKKLMLVFLMVGILFSYFAIFVIDNFHLFGLISNIIIVIGILSFVYFRIYPDFLKLKTSQEI